jgi:hypothetical protein
MNHNKIYAFLHGKLNVPCSLLTLTKIVKIAIGKLIKCQLQHISFRNYQCSIVMKSIGFLILNMKFFLFYSDFILDTRMLPFIDP